MTYAWARDFVLQLINQYSMAGATVAVEYNNQADYLVRIPKLLDDAQMYVATTVRRLRATAPLKNLPSEERGAWVVYKLPRDCWQVMSGGLIRFAGDRLQRYHRYHLLGSDELAVPRGMDEETLLEYFRKPALLGDSPADTAELDNAIEVQMALPYYVAAHLVMYDNAFAYQALYNEWEGKLARLYELPQTELTVVEDAYNAAEWSDDGCL